MELDQWAKSLGKMGGRCSVWRSTLKLTLRCSKTFFMWAGAICLSMWMRYGRALCARTFQEHGREQRHLGIVFMLTAWLRKHVKSLAGIQTSLSSMKSRWGCSKTEPLSKVYPDTPSTIASIRMNAGLICTDNAPTSGAIAHSIRGHSATLRHAQVVTLANTWDMVTANGHQSFTQYSPAWSKLSTNAWRSLETPLYLSRIS